MYTYTISILWNPIPDMMDIRKYPTLLSAAALLPAAALLAAPADAQEPCAQPDDTWIDIDGTVQLVDRVRVRGARTARGIHATPWAGGSRMSTFHGVPPSRSPHRTTASMRTHLLPAAGVLALGLMVPGGLAAQSGPSLIQADELRMRISDGDAPVILWVGDDDAWDGGRIPGARRIGLEDVSVSYGAYAEPGSFVLDLPFELDRVREALEERGVSSDRDVVVAFDSPRRFTHATRVLWTLGVLGMGDRARLLDGGQAAWVDEGGDLTTEPASARGGTITTMPVADRVVGLGWLAREYRSEGLSLIDARSSASYTGEREEFPGRAGHIPGAGSLPIEALLDEGGRMLPTSELAALLREAGATDDARVVTYCHIGQRASAAWFAATLAGFDAAIYDGSMNEWGRTELPLTSGSNR